MIEQPSSWRNALRVLGLRLEEYVCHDDLSGRDEVRPEGRDPLADAAQRAIDAMDEAGIGPEIGEMWNGTPEKEIYGHAVELRDWLRSRGPNLLTPKETLLAEIQAARDSSTSTVPENAFMPTSNDLVVLGCLAASRHALPKTEIEAELKGSSGELSRKTIGDVMKILEQNGLVRYPKGPRMGAAITAEGRKHTST